MKFSKNQIKKATKKLIENHLSLEEKIECLKILTDFRSSHSYPMQSMNTYFRKKTFEVDKKAVVVQRLKRIPSILAKLKRFPNMQVSTMGDIGGIRIITNDFKKIEKIKDQIINGRTRNPLIGQKDYINEPKDSGYRGIHLMYSYQGSQKIYQNFRIELQIRSQIQHAWATAVEVVGTFQRQNLKASQGEKAWLDFFKLVSFAFANIETKQPMAKTLQEQLKATIDDLNVFTILQSFSITVRHSNQRQGFYLLQLHIEEETISVRHFNHSLLLDAYAEYRRIEQEISEDTTQDVVLVSAQSLSELKKAYPNYFADTHIFLNKLKEVINYAKNLV